MKRFLSLTLAILLCLSSFLTLGLTVFAEDGASVTGPEWSVEDRNYSHANGYGLYFRPVVAADGSVSAKAYRTVCTKYDNLHNVTEGDVDVETFEVFGKTTLGVADDGFLKIGSTSTENNSRGVRLRWNGILPTERAKYVAVSYRIIGMTQPEKYDRKNLSIGNAGKWNDTGIVSIPLTQTDGEWGFAVQESTLSGNWFSGSTVWIQFPELRDTNAYVVLDFIGFCETEADAQAMKAEHDSFIAALQNFVPAPTVDLASGTFYEAQTVTVTAKDGVEIRYTTDGTDPTMDSPIYTGAIPVDADMTLKVIGVRDGKTSNVITREYVIKSNTCVNPAIKLPGEYFPKGTRCEITTTDEGATIYYTTDGSDPSAASGALYTAPFVVEKACTIKAIAIKEGFTASAVVSKAVTKIGKDCYYWVFSGIKSNPTGVAYVGDEWHLLDGYKIGNDTDGSCKLPFKINSETGAGEATINSWWESYAKYDKRPNSAYPYVKICYKSTIDVDFQMMFDYYNNLGLDKDEEGNTVKNNHALHKTHSQLAKSDSYTSVVVNMAELCKIWDKFAGGVLSTGITLDAQNATENDYFNLKYIAFFATEEAADAFDMVSVPAFSVPEGFYNERQTVELSVATESADIYYTIDGTEPSATNGIKYTGALILSQNTTLKAIAVKNGMASSTVVTVTYEISLKAKQPTINVPGGKYTTPQQIIINTATEGAQIYYTTDGSTPSATNGILYSGPFTLSKTCILRAVAIADGMNDSTITAVNYKFDIEETSGNDTGENRPDTGTKAVTSDETPKASGCGSTIGAPALIASLILGGMAIGLKKKKED